MGSMNCLPDDLLVHILSFLPTKQAASTSLLSKRWRTLFAFCHNLDFDDSVIFRKNRNNINDIQKSFRDFVDRTLALHGGAPLKKFSLNCKEDEHNMDYVVSWICNALELGVAELHLVLTNWWSSLEWEHLYPKVFTSTTLVKLSLGPGHAIKAFPSDTSLPSLKTLFIDRIGFNIEEFSNVFLPACPVLEELTLNHAGCPNRQYVISSKTIKRLSFTNHGPGLVTLDTPSVVELYLSDYSVREYNLNCNLDSLEKATLDFHLPEQLKPDVTMTDLIKWIRHVKTLHLTSSSVEVILACHKNGLPVFKNLVELTFSSNRERSLKVFLPHLLEHSPNLETLVLSGLDRLCGIVMISIPTNNQVKTLHIKEYRGNVKEVIHIRRFLQKMQSLQVLKISYAIAMDDDPEKVKKLTENTLKLHEVASSSKLKLQIIM